MAYFRLALAPGIDKQNTEYGAEGGWIDGDYIRFRYGLPEKLGGWIPFEYQRTYLVGMVSNIHTWTDLANVPYTIVGTTRKLYVYQGGRWADITPIRVTTTAGDIEFTATNGSSVVEVYNLAHGAIRGDFVTFSDAVSLGGNITADILNQEYEIQTVIDNDNYTILVPAVADALDTGDGGSDTVGAYQINIGSDISFFDFGWGVDTWGLSTWGTPRPYSSLYELLSRVWQFDSYGEDIICQQMDGGTYLFDTSGGLVNNRATQIVGAPTRSTYAVVSIPDRHLICFGTETTVGVSSTQDPMFVRYSNQEDISNFQESATNTAGGQRLTDGNRIISAVRSRGQILVFTDTALHGMQYIGPPYTFGFQQLGVNCGCIGPHAAADVNGLAFWMGTEAFYVFDGTVKKLACTVQDYVFKDINIVQGTKTHVGVNSQFNEVTWWYCSFDSNQIDRFVTYNYLENTWHVGTMARNAWTDLGTYKNPVAANFLPTSAEPTISTIQGLTAGRSLLYSQEFGQNADGQPIHSYIKSGYFDLGEGDAMMYMKRFIPDFKDQIGNLTVKLLMRPYAQGTALPSSLDPYVISPSTEKVDTRARGRQISIEIDSSELDARWRFGTLRVDIQPDGLR